MDLDVFGESAALFHENLWFVVTHHEMCVYV